MPILGIDNNTGAVPPQVNNQASASATEPTYVEGAVQGLSLTTRGRLRVDDENLDLRRMQEVQLLEAIKQTMLQLQSHDSAGAGNYGFEVR